MGISAAAQTATFDATRILDCAPFCGTAVGNTAWVYLSFTAEKPGPTTFGFGADWWYEAYLDGKIISSVMSFYFRDGVLPYYGGGVAEARAVAGNDFMYWDLMRRACERGLKVFDFGRSKRGTGSFDFKKNWGFEPTPLHYEYFLVTDKTVPEINPLNPKYRLFIQAWKKMPLALANAIGPHIVKNLG